ncbi:hypothetical protein MBLNU230_g3530t1 [Neophaeotheca triangularis]
MASTKPSPRTWTLLFKIGKTTILLHIDPLQKLSSIKTDLLATVNQTHPSGTLNSLPIPSDPETIRFARAIDENDLSLGFEPLDAPFEPDDLDAEAVDGQSKGKGKGRGKAKNGLADCPQGVGLKDGSIVAFKFGNGASADDEDEAVVVEGAEEKWDVDLPTMEAAYGEGEEEDMPG